LPSTALSPLQLSIVPILPLSINLHPPHLTILTPAPMFLFLNLFHHYPDLCTRSHSFQYSRSYFQYSWSLHLFTRRLCLHLPPSVDILGNQRPVYLRPCLCCVGCKRPLVLEMEVRVSVYLIIIVIIHLYIAINELQRDVNQIQSINPQQRQYKIQC